MLSSDDQYLILKIFGYFFMAVCVVGFILTIYGSIREGDKQTAMRIECESKGGIFKSYGLWYDPVCFKKDSVIQ